MASGVIGGFPGSLLSPLGHRTQDPIFFNNDFMCIFADVFSRHHIIELRLYFVISLEGVIAATDRWDTISTQNSGASSHASISLVMQHLYHSHSIRPSLFVPYTCPLNLTIHSYTYRPQTRNDPCSASTKTSAPTPTPTPVIGSARSFPRQAQVREGSGAPRSFPFPACAGFKSLASQKGASICSVPLHRCLWLWH